MKPFSGKRFSFIGKSLLWSLLLYVAMMAAFNWDDVRNSVTGKNSITIVKPTVPGEQVTDLGTPQPVAPDIAHHAPMVKSMLTLLRTIIGFQSR